jgi:hypothetical protein
MLSAAKFVGVFSRKGAEHAKVFPWCSLRALGLCVKKNGPLKVMKNDGGASLRKNSLAGETACPT